MFYLDIESPRMQKALSEHYENCRYVVKKRLLGPAFKETPPQFQKSGINKVNVSKAIFNYLNDEDNLKLILTGLPEELNKIKSKFLKERKDISKILSYDYFNRKGKYDKGKELVDRYNSFHLTTNLGYNTCVYCNRNYINTITNGFRIHKFKNKRISPKFLIARPTLDHWFPRSKFPVLAISFFNLIPTCSVCNSSLKGTIQLNLKDHFHPYHRNDNKDKQLKYKFNYDLDDPNNANLILESANAFSKKSIDAYSLEKLYSGHNSDLRDLLKLKKHFGNSYLKNLETILRNTDITPTEMQRIIFGNTSLSDNALKSPLSKFRVDILTKLGILKF